jgi:general secretion pathway protein M
MSDSTLNTARANLRNGARAWWAGLARREQRLVLVAAGVLGAFLLWSLAVAPAWRTLATAPALLAAGDAQAQQMQALAAEAGRLRAVAPVPMAQAQAALSAATGRLGEAAKLSLQGERAVVALKGISGDQLSAWLAEARAGARARVVEASLSQTTPGLYDGSLTLALGTAR